MNTILAPNAIHERLCNFIAALRGNTPVVTDVTKLIYTNGCCADFYKALKMLFPEAVPYGYDCWDGIESVEVMNDIRDEIGFAHVITQINGRFYDINGEFTLGVPFNSITDKMCDGGKLYIYDELTEDELNEFCMTPKDYLVESIATTVAQALDSALRGVKSVDEHKPKLSPLIEKHFREIQFDLRLKFKKSVKVGNEVWPEAYVGDKGPVQTAAEAIYFTSGPLGESCHFILRWFIDECGFEWLRAGSILEDDLEVVSELGEM